ncbi:MAG: hypothetical protein U0704_12220 [Candidatus Eisenbacteria bacterium]
MNVSADFGIWVAALLTLCCFSFLWRDNPLYKFAEHLFVGVSAGYYIALNWWTVVDQYLVVPLRAVASGKLEGGAFAASMQDYRAWLVIPAVLGVLLFTRLFTRLSWMSRWSLAVVMGVYAGLKTTGFAQGDLVAQVQASLMPLWVPGQPWASFNAVLFTVGLITSLLFFFYSREHKGVLGGVSRVGVWFLMISFGAGYGYTVMSRVSLLIGRFQFLLGDWLHLR